MSDNILNRALNENSYASSINITTQDGVQSSILNINEIGNARQTMFNVKMNKEEDSVQGKSKIDTDGKYKNYSRVFNGFKFCGSQYEGRNWRFEKSKTDYEECGKFKP